MVWIDIKYSIESVDDLRHKEVRGQQSNFSESYKKILKLLDIKAQRNLDTTIVITMINLNKSWQQEEFEKVKEAFKGMDVYVYLKSQDQMWYEDNQQTTQSIHWIEFCQFPWSSMTSNPTANPPNVWRISTTRSSWAMPTQNRCTISGMARNTTNSAWITSI